MLKSENLFQTFKKVFQKVLNYEETIFVKMQNAGIFFFRLNVGPVDMVPDL